MERPCQACIDKTLTRLSVSRLFSYCRSCDRGLQTIRTLVAIIIDSDQDVFDQSPPTRRGSPLSLSQGPETFSVASCNEQLTQVGQWSEREIWPSMCRGMVTLAKVGAQSLAPPKAQEGRVNIAEYYCILQLCRGPGRQKSNQRHEFSRD